MITMTALVSFFAIRDPAIERNDLIKPLILIYPVNTLLLFMNFSFWCWFFFSRRMASVDDCCSTVQKK